MKGDTCGFLHEFNPERMPVCRSLLKYGVCKEPDCPYKHSLTDIKVRLSDLCCSESDVGHAAWNSIRLTVLFASHRNAICSS